MKIGFFYIGSNRCKRACKDYKQIPSGKRTI